MAKLYLMSPGSKDDEYLHGMKNDTRATVLAHLRLQRAHFALCLALLSLSACRSHDFPQFPANYREYAYVTNGGSATVSIYDVVNVRLDREVPVGPNPVAVVASPTRNEVYIVNSGMTGGSGSVSILNAESNTIAATIPVHHQPVALALA